MCEEKGSDLSYQEKCVCLTASLFSLSDSTIDRVEKSIEESNLSECQLFRKFVIAIALRPRNRSLLVDLFIRTMTKLPKLKEQLLKLLHRESLVIAHCHLLHMCHLAGHVSTREVLATVFEFLCCYVFSFGKVYIVDIVMCYFARELSCECAEFYARWRESINNVSMLLGRGVFLTNFLTEFEKLQANDWQIYEEMRQFGFPLHSAEYFIMNNDCDGIAVFMASESFDPNAFISDSAFDITHVSFKRPTYLQFAAAMGSVDVVRFLIMNGGDCKVILTEDNDNSLDFAIMGGNHEIIRLMQQNLHQNSEVFHDVLYAIQHHWNDIARWLVENNPDMDLSEMIHQSCQFDNLEMLLWCLDSGIDINKRNHGNATPFMKAAASLGLDCFYYLMEQGIDIDACDKVVL